MEQSKPIETLGQAYEAGWQISARCAHGKMRGMKSRPECHSHVELDMDTLLWTRGQGFPIDRLASRLKCPNCWSRRIALWLNSKANVNRTKVTPT